MKLYLVLYCAQHISMIEAKAASFLGMDKDHIEPLQVVSYTKGQHFAEHHDAGVATSCL